MSRTLKIILARTTAVFLLVAASCAVPCLAAPRTPVWETVREYTPSDADSADTLQAPEIEMTVSDGHIYITVTHPVTVEVFTILGQPVTSRKLLPGTTRLTMGMKGIFILKGAGTTKRINL